jgi:predicted DNA-binding protein YlxM (UPF0122 family)
MDNLLVGNTVSHLSMDELSSSIELTGPNKNYIAFCIINNNLSMGKIARSLKLSRQTIQSWVSRCRKGHTNYSNGGRPPGLDSISIIKIKKIIVQQNQFEFEYLKSLCRDEHINTVKRQRVLVEEDDIKPFSRRSKIRYAYKLMVVSDDDSELGFSDENEVDNYFNGQFT